MLDFATARRNMLQNQIAANRVSDPAVLEAMGRLPREMFVPKALRPLAYSDEHLDFGNGRCLLSPMVLGRLLQGLRLQAEDAILDLGCGMGYTSAVMAAIGATVLAVDHDQRLLETANAAFAELGIDNIAVVQVENLTDGLAEQAPFDAILLAGAVLRVPETILFQLAEGGRLACVLQPPGAPIGRGTVILRSGGAFGETSLFETAAPFMPGFDSAEEEFVF